MADFGANNEGFRHGPTALEHGIPSRDTFRGVSVAGSAAARGGDGAVRRGLAAGIARLANNKMSFRRRPLKAARVPECRVDLIKKAVGFSTEIEPR